MSQLIRASPILCRQIRLEQVKCSCKSCNVVGQLHGNKTVSLSPCRVTVWILCARVCVGVYACAHACVRVCLSANKKFMRIIRICFTLACVEPRKLSQCRGEPEAKLGPTRPMRQYANPQTILRDVLHATCHAFVALLHPSNHLTPRRQPATMATSRNQPCTSHGGPQTAPHLQSCGL